MKYMDLNSKDIFLFDLDDTLINTREANDIALRRAYKKLTSISKMDLSEKLPKEKFIGDIKKIYEDSKNRGEKRYYDYDPTLFEEYCEKLPSNLGLRYMKHSLAARLFWHFKETKYRVLMPHPDTFNILNSIHNKGKIAYCVTQGTCNYQHTKAMLTGIEEKVEAVQVTERKEEELEKFVDEMEFDKEKTVMIGDSETDIKAGKNSGINTICIGNEHNNHDQFENKADIYFEDLRVFLDELNKKEHF